MKKVLLHLVLILGTSIAAFAQDYSAKTGDADLDKSLKNININAHADLPVFKHDLSVDFGISEGKLDELMVQFKLEPADLYMVLQLGKLTNKPCEEVGDLYQKDKGKGWGVIAKELGIKPGSAEFHALKNQSKAKGNKNKSKGDKGGKGKGKGKGKKGKGKKK